MDINEPRWPTPTINVNLEQCQHAAKGRPLHGTYCSAAPVLIPCHLPPTVEFTVRLGECECGGRETFHSTTHAPGILHRDDCPGRPIRVGCSIGGKTWEESEPLGLVKVHEGNELSTAQRIGPLVHVRWALVKALVLGRVYDVVAGYTPEQMDRIADLHAQRDTVYAAIAKIAKAEQAIASAVDSLPEQLRLPVDLSSRAGRVLRHFVAQLGALP